MRDCGGRRILVLGVAVVLCLSALLAAGILLFGHFGRTEGRILGTTAMLAGCGLLALPGVVLLDRRRLRGLALAVVGLAAATYALAVTTIWHDSPPDALGKTLGTIVLVTVAAAQTAALAARRQGADPPSVRRLFPVSIGIAVTACALLSALIWGDGDGGVLARVAATLVVLDVLAVALQPLLARARPPTAPIRLRLLLDTHETVEVEVRAADLAAAAVAAIHAEERQGRRVLRLETPDVATDGRTAPSLRKATEAQATANR
jgi:hypothetical protein